MEISKMTDMELVELARQDNENAKEELLNRCRNVISYNVVKYKNMYHGRLNRFDVEDLIAECHIAVLEAILLYNPIRGAAFPTFSMFIIRKRLLTFLQKTSKQTRYISDVRLDRLPAAEDITKDLTIKTNNDRDKEIVKLLLQGMRKADIARQFGLSRMAITKIIRKVIK